MNRIKSISLTVLSLVTVAVAARAQDFRTDINPALRYYEAIILEPNLSPQDHDYLFTNEWRGQKLPERFGDLISSFHNSFEMVREAGHATVPSDWGIDLSGGPETLLPHLARCKQLAVTDKLRVMWELQNGKEKEARDDLLAMFALGRNSSTDGTLIAVLVDIAIENIAMNTVAENFNSFSNETLQQVVEGFDAAPAGKSASTAILTGEKTGFHDWFKTKIVQWQKENPGDDAKVMAKLRDLFQAGDEGADRRQRDLWQAVTKVANTSDAVLKLIQDQDGIHERAAAIMALPHPAFEAQEKQFQADLDKSANPLTAILFPAIAKARPKEFRTQIKLAMLHAAVAYKTNAVDGFNSVTDPCGEGPFHFDRFIFEGADRGFRLTSAYNGNGYPETMIFVETDGTPFVCDGVKAGQPLSN